MIPSQKCIDLIKKLESIELNSYQDGGGVWTIGYGSTMWMDGKRVTKGQTVTLEMAEKLLAWELKNKGDVLTGLLGKSNVNQQQFDALLSFTYNVGVGAVAKSTLLKKAIRNANDPTIKDEFLKWVYDNGKRIKGLENRRKQEIALYFS